MMRRIGHSLIEMLVVLIIVGVLIAIIVPAVQRAREAARMAQCIHNQGQLAKAIHLHLADEPYGRFPGFRAFASDGTTQLGWAAQVFEYLGRSDLDPTEATYVEVLVCPSDQRPTDAPRLNYVVNGGQAGIDSPVDGIFFDHAKDAKVYITKDDFRDGLTNTIMLAENLDATEWNVTDEMNQCILWPLTVGNEVNNGMGARPSSHHPGGFVAAFADGSVKFMSEKDINDDANIGTADSYYVALLTPGGYDADAIAPGGGGGGGSGPSCEEIAASVPGGLRAHYTFDDAGDPGADASGNGYDGTVIGAVIENDAERCGDVLHFSDGGASDTGDVMNLPDGVLHGVGDLTITVWIKIEGTVPVWFIHAYGPGGGSYGDNNSTSFGYDGGGTFGMYNHGAATVWPSTPAPSSGWQHLAMIRDLTNNEHRLFIDGQEIAGGEWALNSQTTLEPTNITPGALQVGQEQDCPAGCWEDFQRLEGPIDDLRFYERVLTAEEIATLAGQ